MKKKAVSQEYERFDKVMRALMTVPHSEVKARLDAEKADKLRPSIGRQNGCLCYAADFLPLG